MTRQGPKTADDKATLEILGAELILVGFGNARVVLVLLLGSLEVPLLTIGKELDDDEEEDGAREGQVGKAKGFGALVVCGDDENVGRGGDKKQKQRLGYCDEAKVKDAKNESIVHLGLHDLPAIILGADRVSSFAPVVESQANLLRRLWLARSLVVFDEKYLTLQRTLMAAIVSKV